MSIAPLYQRFVDDELALAPALIERVIAGSLQLLGPSRDAAAIGSDLVHHAEIVTALQRSSALYQQSFIASLRRQVAAEIEEQRGAPSRDPRASADALELMDESRVEVDIEISRAMQLIDSTAEWELRELQTFTSTLIGIEHVTAESNPFRPLVYATALWDAACAVVPTQVQRAILLRTSAGVAAGLLKNAWASAATRLEAQGVEPGVYRTVVLPSASAAFGRPAAEAPRQGPLSALLGSMPQTAVPEANAGPRRAAQPSRPGALAPMRQDGASRRNPELEKALLRLDQLLRQPAFESSRPDRQAGSAIEQQRAALLASASEPLERQTIELVTRMFESLLADSQLQGALQPVIARMQLATLRLCLADQAALESYEHPVWRLLDRMGSTSQGYSRAEDPRLSSFVAFAAAVAEEMAGATLADSALFRRGLNRIEAFLAEQLQEQVRAAHRAIAALQLAERREVLQQLLSQRLAEQMTQVRTSPAIRRFVTGTWARVITEAMLRHGEQSEQTLDTMKTADDLLWSLHIPDHPQSRQRLMALIPRLLQRLRAGVDSIALPRSEQDAAFNELMTIHTEALRPGARSSGASGGAASPEDIVQRMRDEVIADPPLARSFADSVIDLSSMETVPAEHLPSSSGNEDPSRRIDALRVGDRQRMFLHGRWNRVQLLWRSDRGLFFLFAGESRSQTHSITGRALERLASAGLVQPVESKPLVQRAVDRMMRGLAAAP